jgi:hypothetical protein
MSIFHQPGTPCPVHGDQRRDDCRWCGEAQPLTCPSCGSTSMEEPAANRHGAMSTMCHDCGADMLTEAATPGTDAHQFIWNSRNEDFRQAGYTGVSVNEQGKRCCGGGEPLPVPSVAWEDADGWLWCRMHLDAQMRANEGRLTCSCGTAWADEPGHDNDQVQA